ncbi:hypothetical protein [Acuticoccus kandeliae]|nr:hypothetical protein [Acuticoccus kandeliae]
MLNHLVLGQALIRTPVFDGAEVDKSTAARLRAWLFQRPIR